MKKNIKALLLGYILFKVNCKVFLLYNNGLKARKSMQDSVYFDGFNIFRFKWERFYLRTGNITWEENQ